jgi:hypothetical protein
MTPPRATTHSLCGTAVRADRVQLLATMLGGDGLAEKLERAVANRNTIVALSFEERERIVDVLAATPGLLPDLRSALEAQVRKQSQQRTTFARANRDREMVELRRGTARDEQ